MTVQANFFQSKGKNLALTLTTLATLSGCATTANPGDPFEGYNRTMFRFNESLDRVVLKPVAHTYRNITPTFVQTGIDNFFENLSDLWSSVNNFAQLKGQNGLNDLTRFAFNSTFGLVGVLDLATPAGLPKHHEDLGQTLGYWGVPAGPYLVLPLLGPSTVRDTVSMPGDIWGDPLAHANDIAWRNTGIAIRTVNNRANLLGLSSLLEDVALDRYEFVRDSYLQRRNSLVLDTEKVQKQTEHGESRQE
jgi:phospholipid-binding lipoprotein MlaA